MKKWVRTTLIVAGAIVLAWGIIAIVAPDKRRLSDEVRSDSSSEFVRLSEGLTEYEVAGPEGGPPVILIHGVTVPMFDWDRQFEALAGAGFRVLRYNQYGRGLSDRPRGAYGSARYVQQVLDIMESQGWTRAHLVGHSMGAEIAAMVAVRDPDRVSSIVLISPVFNMAADNAGVSLVKIPLVGDIAAKLLLPRILAGRADALFETSGTEEADLYSSAFRVQTRYRGFTRSVKSLFRNEMMDDLSIWYSALSGQPTLGIWGTLDETVPREHFESVSRYIPHMEAIVLNGVGHMPTMEVPDQINEALVQFLSGRE